MCLPVLHHAAAAPTRKTSTPRTPRRWSATTATTATCASASTTRRCGRSRTRKDGKTRYVELRIPVTEGPALQGRRRQGRRQQGGQVRGAASQVFKLKPGDFYSEKRVRKGLEKAREIYGSIGYFEFTALPRFRSSATCRKDAQPPQHGRRRSAPPPTAAARRRKRRPGHRRRDDAHAGGRAVLRQPHHLRRQHDHARQRDPPRDAAGRERRLQHRGAQAQRQAPQSARLLQGARGRRERQGRQDAEREEQGRRHAEARGAEPQPADVRRRRVAVRGRLRPVRPSRRRTSSAGRDAVAVGAGRHALHRTTSSSFTEPYLFDRPITGGVNVFNRTDQLHRRVHAGVDGRQRRCSGSALAELHARLHVVQLRAGRDQRPEPGLHGSRRHRQHEPVPGRRAAPRRAAASAPSARSSPSLVHNTVDNPIFPTHRAALHGQLRPRRPRRQHQLLQAAARGHPVLPADAQDVGRRPRPVRVRRAVARHAVRCRSSSGWSWAASTASAATTSAPSVRATTSRGWSSAATRACCSTASTSIQIAGPVRVLPSTTPARSATTGEKFRVGRLRRLDGRRGPLLHAGAQRAVPADFRAATSTTKACSTTTTSPRRSGASASPSGRPSSAWTGCIG